MASATFPVSEDKRWTCLTDDDLRAVARTLFIEVDMTRVSEGDYESAVAILREIYNYGRARGVREVGSGRMD